MKTFWFPGLDGWPLWIILSQQLPACGGEGEVLRCAGCWRPFIGVVHNAAALVVGECTGIERDGESEKRTIAMHTYRERVAFTCSTCHKMKTWHPRRVR
jgi:hypothetical protein